MAISTAVPANAVARVLGIKTIFKDLRAGRVQHLPQRIVVIGQGNSANTFPFTKVQVTSALEVGQVFGFGSPLYESVIRLFPINGSGVGLIPVTVIPVDAGGSAVVATGTITATGTATAQFTGRVRVGGILSPEFVIVDTDTATLVGDAIAAAINAELDMPVTAVNVAGVVTLTAKWLGSTGNDIKFELVDTSVTSGVTFVLVAMSSGAISPDVTTALDQIGSIWETLVVNAAAPYTDTTTLDAFASFFEARWDPLVKTPGNVVTGTFETDRATLQSAGDARRTDRSNILANMPGCKNTPWAMAAREVAELALSADFDPARDFGSLPLTDLIPGTDAEQFEYVDLNLLVSAGISTTTVRDGVITISDTVTFYHPTGDQLPAYRFFKTIVKLQQLLFNLKIEFEMPEWDGAPLLPDDSPTTNPSARKPKTAVAAVNAIIDALALDAILSDPATAKAQTVAQISATDPDRLDISLTVQVSGNSNKISIDQNFGFFFGAQ